MLQPIIIDPGIYLPSGVFLSNNGMGHARNARMYCRKYKELESLMWSSNENEDEFLISAGCAIVASYRGEWVLKVPRDSQNPFIEDLISRYEGNGFNIAKYWTINSEYKECLDRILESEPKMLLITI